MISNYQQKVTDTGEKYTSGVVSWYINDFGDFIFNTVSTLHSSVPYNLLGENWLSEKANSEVCY